MHDAQRAGHSPAPDRGLRRQSRSPVSLSLTSTSSTSLTLPSVPVVQTLARWDLAGDVYDDRLAFPVLDQLLLPQMAVHELFGEFHARIIDDRRIRLEPAIEGHGDRPRTREHFGIFDRHFVADCISADRRITLDKMQRVAMKISSPIEPVFSVEVRDVDNQRIFLPMT